MDIVSVRLIKDICTYFYMIIKWATSRGIPITTILKFLNFAEILTQSKAHLLDGIDRECTFQMKTSNSLSISAQSFLRMNTNSRVNSTILTLLALNTRISCEWFFQNLRTKHVSKFVGSNLSDGRNAHDHSTFINPSAFLHSSAVQHFFKIISLKL